MTDETKAAKVKTAATLRWALVAMAIVGAAALLYVIGASSFKPKASADLSALAKGSLAKLVVLDTPRPAPTNGFTDAAGKPVTLADFKGQVVVLNFWATWCAPCKQEMPTLAKLQASYAAAPVKVVALSTDREKDFPEAVQFIAANAPLSLYHTPGIAMPLSLTPKIEGFPTTMIIDRKGMERARLAGDADWSSPEARELIERLLKEG